MQSTAQKNDDFFSKCDQIRKKSLIENLCAVKIYHFEYSKLTSSGFCF